MDDINNPDPEMLKNLDLLIVYDVLEQESDWETLSEEDEDNPK